MDPQTPSPDEPRPSVDDLGLTTPSPIAQPPVAGGVIQPTQSSPMASPDEHESLDLSQLNPPVISSQPNEPDESLVKPAPPVQPRSMPAFMQQPGQSSTSNTTTNTVHHYGPASPPSPSSGGNGIPPAANTPPQAPFSPPPQQIVMVKKSHTVLIIVMILILLLAGGAAAFFLLKNKKNNTANTPATTNTAQTNTKTDATPATTDEATANATVAKSLSDFDAVCNKGSISNAAAYNSNKTAVIYGFRNSPRTPDYWTPNAVGYGKSYYPGTDYSKVSVVACLTYINDSPSVSKDCEYTDSNDKAVTVKYISTKYSLAFYEAKTGKLISEGEDINGPATSCPSFVSYDKSTNTAYASPDDNAVEAAFDTFVK